MGSLSLGTLVGVPVRLPDPRKKLVQDSWLRHLVTRKAKHLQHDSTRFLPGQEQADREVVTDLDEADIITSRFQGEGIETHALLLDLDIEHTYVPSSTPGHGHLLINAKLTQHEWLRVMNLLASVGVIEQGYREMSEKRGYASLRLPWVKKEGV